MAKEFTYKMNIDAEIGDLTSKLKTVKSALASVVSDGKEPKLAKILEQLDTRLDALKTKANTPIKSEAAFGGMEKEVQSIERLLERLGEEFGTLSKKTASEKIAFLPEGEQKKLQDAVNAMKAYTGAIEASTKKSKELVDAEKKQLTAESQLEKKRKELADLDKSGDAIKARRDAAEIAKKEAKAVQDDAHRRLEAAQQELELIREQAKAWKEAHPDEDQRKAKYTSSDGSEITMQKAIANVKSAEANVAASDNAYTQATDEYKQAKAAADSYATSLGTLQTAVTKQQTVADTAKQKVKELTDAFDANKLNASNMAFAELRQKAQDLGISLDGIGIENTSENVALLKQRMEEFVTIGVEPANALLETARQATESMGTAADNTTKSIHRETEAFKEQNEQAGQVDGLMSRIKQFTGITGVALVMRRALQSAINTTKELDKQMTAMAVVTDLEVGDYWKQLPEHTAQANKLGVAIKDVYEAETLYYQQGLKTAQVQKLSTSTLKMARIAGLSAEDATNKMTAALRGFNMEINETNADRIADVYSKLAAITASDVQEISTAMTKTASLASNAGMEFETTAAFLSQIIETTRESAETAGTALKTVIARFQELKKSPEEIGEVEGEIIDANKIETALRSVGVALRDAQGQFRDLDDVFMDLSSKWDTLDTNTQRYIATIAAGSRQQSRFIAMMSDYSRTSELVNAANNAAGASNEQFNKTLESLQSKLAQLKNAWDTFTQGIANNEFIKIGVDILTGILGVINKITQGFGPWSGSALKIGLVTAALIAGDKALKIFMASLRANTGILGAFGKVASSAGASVKKFFTSIKMGTKTWTTYSAAFQQGKAASEAYTKATNTATQAETLRNNAAQMGLLTTKTEAAYNSILAKTEATKAASLSAVAQAYGLTVPQQLAAQSLTALGIDLNGAALLAQQGVTKEQLLAAAADQLGAKATEEQIVAKAGEIGMLYAEEAAEKTGNIEKSKGILLRLSEAATNLLVKLGLGGLIGAKAGDTTATVAETGATVAQTGANIGLLATLWPILVVTLLITAAVLALIAIILIVVNLVKAIKANTLEGQIEAQKEKVKQYNEVLENSKTALDELREAHEKYKELQDTYKNLTKGTKEWRQALLEANQQVLQLIQKYPELTKYLKRDGEALTIEEEGWDHILDKQQQAVNLNAAASLGAQAQLSTLQAKKDTRDYYDTYSLEFQSENFLTAASNLGTMTAAVASLNPAAVLLTGGLMKAEKAIRRVTDDWGAFGTVLQGVQTGALLSTFMGPVLGNIVGFTATLISQRAEAERREQTQDFAAAMVENGLSFEEIDRSAVKDLYKSIFDKEMTDEIYEAMANSSDALFDLGNSTLAARVQMDTFAQQLVTNALDMASITNEWRESLQGFGAGELSGENVEGKIDEAVKELSKSMNYKDALKEYAELTGQSYAQGKVYSTNDITQQTEDTEVKVSKDIVWRVLAQNKVTGETATRLDAVSVELQRAALTMSKSEKERTKRLISNDASSLTQSDLKAIAEAGGAQEWLTQHGVNIQLTDAELAKITESIDNANKDSESRLYKLRETGSFSEGTVGNITAGLTGLGIQGLVEKFSTLTDRFGEETTNRTAQIMEEFGNQLSSPELREAFNAQVAAADWSNTESFENLTEVLGTMADLTEQDTIVLQTWSKAMGATVHALTTINLDNLRKQVASLNKTINDMFEGNRNIDDESYQNLIDMGFSEKDFQKTAEGFRYLGQTGDLLRSASEAAYQGVAAANANFEASRAETEHSLQVITDLENEIAAHAQDRRDTEVEQLSAMEAIWEWIKGILAKIREHVVAFATWIYDHIIKPISDALTKLFNAIHDGIAWIHNTLGSILSQAWTDFCNAFIRMLNGFIKFYNNTLGYLLGNIEYIKQKENTFEAMETSDQIARRKELEEQQKRLVDNIAADTENLQKIAEAYAQAADALDIGELRTAQADYAKLYDELAAKMDAATSVVVKNAYAEEIKALQEVLNSLDKSLMSKALNYEDLAPDVRRFQAALEQGNTEVAEDLRQKLANAIASKDAAKRLNKAFTKIGEDLENVLSSDISADALQKTLEQWSYELGFKNIDSGVQLLAQNFDLLGQIIEGDEDAWRSFQTAMLTQKGFHVEGDIDLSEINEGLTSLRSNAQGALNSLLDTGAFKMQQITATDRVSVPKITYDENGYPTIDGTYNVEAGQMYWQLVPTDFGDLDIEKKDLSGEQPEKWLNPYGWLYNLNQLGEATIQKREDAEWRYQRALDASGTSAKKLVDYLKEAADADRDNLAIEELRYKNAKKTAKDLIKNAPEGFGQYVHLGSNGQLSIDPKLYEVDWTSDMGSVFEDFIGQIEEVKDELKNSIDNLKNIRERAAEKKYTGRSEYGDLVNRIQNAFIDKFQTEIDVLNSINDAIEDAQEKLVDKLQEKIDDDRNAREQEKQEQALTDKTAQLAYLQASGASPLEVLKLQKELEDEQQSYTDSLVDKSIEELQDANQKAADQRQEQIDIAQAQLDWWSENDSAAYAEAQMNAWLEQGDEVALKHIEELLNATEGKNLSSTAMQEWKEETENAVASANVWREQVAYGYYSQLEADADAAIDTLTQDYNSLSAGQARLQNYVDENGNIQGGINNDAAIDLENSAKLNKLQEDWDAAKTAYADAAQQQYDASNTQLQAALKQVEAAAAMAAAANGEGNGTSPSLPGISNDDFNYLQKSILSSGALEGDRARWGQGRSKDWIDAWTSLSEEDRGYIYGADTIANELLQLMTTERIQPGDRDLASYSLSNGMNALEAWNALSDVWKRKIWDTRGSGSLSGSNYVSGYTSSSGRTYSGGSRRFATGGIADYTGPAWLDGTKSNPELVLNQTDTANFIELRNILADILKGSQNGATTGAGNNYYNIDVHVDSIDSDYDIDSAAARMRELIEDDAMYRNVNAIQQIR